MLTDEQLAWLRQRFRWFNPDACASLFHPEQPDNGLYLRRSDGAQYPMVLLSNSTRWYPLRERRPQRDPARGGGPMKSEAPRGMRPLLFDTLEPDELILVEGEGQLAALVSLGFRGVIAAGGTSALTGRGQQAARNRLLLAGKSVRLFFDPDDAGRIAAPRVARTLLGAGVVRAAMVFPPNEGQDLEDWLGEFDSPEAAQAQAQLLLGGVDWEGAVDAAEEEDRPPQPIQAATMPDPDGGRTLVVTTYDDRDDSLALAVFGPPTEYRAHQTGGNASVMHDEPPPEETMTRAWRIVDEWEREGQRYIPDPEVRAALEKGMLILPPPPNLQPDTSEKLWDDLVAFYKRWFAIEPVYYSALAAFCFLTYRLTDAKFEHIGYLNFAGPPGSGKNRGLDVMRYTTWRSYYTRPSASNLHRVIDFYGDFSMVIDEFHLDRGKTEAGTQELVDILNLAFQRAGCLVKMDPGPRGGRMIPHLYPVFGPKIFASYTADSDEAFARRSIVVPTGKAPVPEAMMVPQLPAAAVDEARELRARLLAFRGRRLADGLPELGTTWDKVRAAAGVESAQVFWPLACMVPEGRDDAVADLLEVAAGRRQATREARHASPEAYALDRFAEAWAEGKFLPTVADQDELFLPTSQLAADVTEERVTPSQLARMLKQLGIPHGQRRFRRSGGTEQLKGFIVHAKRLEELSPIFKRHGVEWPRAQVQPSTEDPGL